MYDGPEPAAIGPQRVLRDCSAFKASRVRISLTGYRFGRTISTGGGLYPRILKRLRDCIRERRYVVTLHAQDEMDNDSLSIFDVERVVLPGEIVERQREAKTREWKYLLQGKALDDREVVVVTKMGPTDKLVVITVFLDER